LEEIAEKTSTLASGLAKNLLTAYAGYEYPEVLVEPVFDLDGKSNAEKSKNKDEYREISLYPNPSRGLVFIKGYNEEGLTVEVYNSLGNRVLHTSLNASNGVVDLRELAAGVYSIVLRDASDIVVHKDRIILVR
jgi:hypothetical protein